MKPLSKTFNALSSGLAKPASWLIEYLGGEASATGQKVNVTSALGLPSVIYAVNKISGHLAQLPLDVYRMEEDPELGVQRVDLDRSPASYLINREPNEFMSAYTLREILMVHALITGNGRAYIKRNSMGTPIGLYPIQPQSVRTAYIDGEKWHLVTPTDGEVQTSVQEKIKKGDYWKVRDINMLHIMNTSYNGLWGLHVIDLAKDVFGLGQAGQDSSAYAYQNNGRPGLLLQAPEGQLVNPKDAKEFIENFNEKHEGIKNTGKAGLLLNGMTATTLPLSAGDAQLIEQRNFQREEIALLFGLESIMGDNSGQTYKSISERNAAYINNCLARWLFKWQHEITNKLMTRTDVTVEFDTTPLLKGDPNTLADYTHKMQQTGSLTMNEMRALHGYPPIEDGDKLAHEMAMEMAEKQSELKTAEGEAADKQKEKEKKDGSDSKQGSKDD